MDTGGASLACGALPVRNRFQTAEVASGFVLRGQSPSFSRIAKDIGSALSEIEISMTARLLHSMCCFALVPPSSAVLGRCWSCGR